MGETTSDEQKRYLKNFISLSNLNISLQVGRYSESLDRVYTTILSLLVRLQEKQ